MSIQMIVGIVFLLLAILSFIVAQLYKRIPVFLVGKYRWHKIKAKDVKAFVRFSIRQDIIQGLLFLFYGVVTVHCTLHPILLVSIFVTPYLWLSIYTRYIKDVYVYAV